MTWNWPLSTTSGVELLEHFSATQNLDMHHRNSTHTKGGSSSPMGRTTLASRYGTAYAEAHSAELMLAADGDHFRFLEPADTMWTDLVKAISTPEQ